MSSNSRVGGLSTDLKTLRSNLFLSSVVAIIGIGAPIGLSFVLQGFMDITNVQAFAAGAALCSTSLGTTFTILSTSGLSQSRLGVVLSSAAMMDDIVGLVMSSIISNLGKSSDFSAVTVVRPVLVSVAFAVVLPLICLFIVKPTTANGYRYLASREEGRLFELLGTEGAALTFHTLVLIAIVTAASYAGTSVLFAAYLAGAVSTWWDGVCLECVQSDRQMRPKNVNAGSKGKGKTTDSSPAEASDRQSLQDGDKTEVSVPAPENGLQSSSSQNQEPKSTKEPEPHTLGLTNDKRPRQLAESSQGVNFICGVQIFEKVYQPALQYMLKPFFFASIGFSIPISKMFDGSVIWKGIVYSILMMFGKLLCGLCLLRFQPPTEMYKVVKTYVPSRFSGCWPLSLHSKATNKTRSRQASRGKPTEASTTRIRKPVSLYPAALLGSAMVARGEIGFLISSVAESNGVFGTNDAGGTSQLFLIVTWAILLCTLLGPIAVGLMVKRVRRLQAVERSQRTGRDDPLGAWGVIPSE